MFPTSFNLYGSNNYPIFNPFFEWKVITTNIVLTEPDGMSGKCVWFQKMTEDMTANERTKQYRKISFFSFDLSERFEDFLLLADASS